MKAGFDSRTIEATRKRLGYGYSDPELPAAVSLPDDLFPPARLPQVCPTFLPGSDLPLRLTRQECLHGLRMQRDLAHGTAAPGETVEYLHFSTLGSCHLGPFDQCVRLSFRQERIGEYFL